jgi:hypothetical protein
MLCYIVLYCAMLCYVVLHCATLCYIVLYCAMLWYIVLYCGILCYTRIEVLTALRNTIQVFWDDRTCDPEDGEIALHRNLRKCDIHQLEWRNIQEDLNLYQFWQEVSPAICKNCTLCQEDVFSLFLQFLQCATKLLGCYRFCSSTSNHFHKPL